ncbi:hypothetical protein QBC47DRAFT_402338 [Echria macrotheca]|uniref:Uncharacterized protein n=1 Tax=Echria macrotheca TaxID=438768 RepID=A0AAJ0BFP1_9PEZI|nr:hypothetical protein QBC47DRAFT_402338 [Echria macrotheca]
MPPTLDLTRTAHSKVIISPPRINLRRATSYNHDRGPLSSTSARFNFNHLVFSPPPSPGLPSLSPPPRKPSKGLAGLVRPSRIIRYTVWVICVLVIYYILAFIVQSSEFLLAVGGPRTTGQEPTTQEDLPDFPTAIVVADNRGRHKWTVSIPETERFPLTPAQYAEICTRCRQISAGLSHASDSANRYFLDVREAQEEGHLPRPHEKSKIIKQRHEIDAVKDTTKGSSQKPVCSKSLTFVLESSDAGLGNTLMMLWTAYGLAEREGRAFFLDDTRWAYGKYADIFQSPPAPSCSAPSPQEIVPCPRQARHLVVSASTADENLSQLNEPLAAAGGTEQPSERAEFDLARRGHDALFRLNREDEEYVDKRARELAAKRMVPRTKGTQNGLAIGAHIRRGDRHPLESKYRDSYIPLSTYAEAARTMVEDKFNHTGTFGGEDRAAKDHSFLLLASDDPTVYESAEFTGAIPAQDRIKLASKPVMQRSSPERHVMHKFVDENFGWEGGFFAPMFWNLGVASANAASGQSTPSHETTRLRSLVGRAYMMDLAVLADASDAIICTASAAGCRLLAVMMGWESAMEKGGWVNVDGGSRWKGVS